MRMSLCIISSHWFIILKHIIYLPTGDMILYIPNMESSRWSVYNGIICVPSVWVRCDTIDFRYNCWNSSYASRDYHDTRSRSDIFRDVSQFLELGFFWWFIIQNKVWVRVCHNTWRNYTSTNETVTPINCGMAINPLFAIFTIIFLVEIGCGEIKPTLVFIIPWKKSLTRSKSSGSM